MGRGRSRKHPQSRQSKKQKARSGGAAGAAKSIKEPKHQKNKKRYTAECQENQMGCWAERKKICQGRSKKHPCSRQSRSKKQEKEAQQEQQNQSRKQQAEARDQSKGEIEGSAGTTDDAGAAGARSGRR